jgi:hypothetical protein
MEKRDRGEVVASKHSCSIKVGGSHETVAGSAEITNHQLSFYSDQGEFLSIPFGLVQSITKIDALCVSISCKDVRQVNVSPTHPCDSAPPHFLKNGGPCFEFFKTVQL